MNIRIWNAFASNNSGSYTIVGSFPSEAEAAQVAAELGPVIAAQSQWFTSDAPPPSPLAELARKVGIDWETSDTRDEWPQFGGKESPEVVALGSQVLVHHDYTVTLPEVFGHYFYRRGGAVDTRLNHTHDPLVAVFGVWWDWDEVSQARRAQDIEAICAALAAPGSPITEHLSEHYAPAYRAVPDSGDYPLTIAALFSDLVLGCEAVRRILAPYPCSFRLKIFESFARKEPLAFVQSAKDEEE